MINLTLSLRDHFACDYCNPLNQLHTVIRICFSILIKKFVPLPTPRLKAGTCLADGPVSLMLEKYCPAAVDRCIRRFILQSVRIKRGCQSSFLNTAISINQDSKNIFARKHVPGVPKKRHPFYFCDNFRKCAPILTIFSLVEQEIYVT